MIRFVTYDEEGVILSAEAGETMPEGAMEIPPHIGVMDALKHRVEEGALVPLVDWPELTQTETGWFVEGCPEGTKVQVIDAIAGEILFSGETTLEDPDIDLTLPDTGQYQLTIIPISPYRPQFHILEVQ